MDYTEIIVTVIGLLSVLLTSVLLPWLKAKWDNEKYEKLKKYAGVGVDAAQQLGKNYDWKGSDKFAYVKKYLEEHHIKVDEAVIEAAVIEHFGEGSKLRDMLTLDDPAETGFLESGTEFADGGIG